MVGGRGAPGSLLVPLCSFQVLQLGFGHWVPWIPWEGSDQIPAPLEMSFQLPLVFTVSAITGQEGDSWSRLRSQNKLGNNPFLESAYIKRRRKASHLKYLGLSEGNVYLHQVGSFTVLWDVHNTFLPFHLAQEAEKRQK